MDATFSRIDLAFSDVICIPVLMLVTFLHYLLLGQLVFLIRAFISLKTKGQLKLVKAWHELFLYLAL